VERAQHRITDLSRVGAVALVAMLMSACGQTREAERQAQESQRRAEQAQQEARVLAESLAASNRDNSNLRLIAGTVTRLDATFTVETATPSSTNGPDCFDGTNIGIALVLNGPLGTVTLVNSDFAATVWRQSSGVRALRFTLVPAKSSVATALNVQALSAMKTLQVSLAEQLQAADLATPLSDAPSSTHFTLSLNGLPAVAIDEMRACGGTLSSGTVTYCLAPEFAAIPDRVRRALDNGDAARALRATAMATPAGEMDGTAPPSGDPEWRSRCQEGRSSRTQTSQPVADAVRPYVGDLVGEAIRRAESLEHAGRYVAADSVLRDALVLTRKRAGASGAGGSLDGTEQWISEIRTRIRGACTTEQRVQAERRGNPVACP
jgi:hypothetical protein